MGSERRPFTVAAVQAAPVFLDREATTEKACELIATAGRNGARLIVLPESFIPAYPDWVWSVPAGDYRTMDEMYGELASQSVDVPGPVTEALGNAARAANAYVVVGVTERNAEASRASLYNTVVFFDDAGNLMGKHRKLMPTGGERLVWAQGDGSTLQVFDTALGRIGALTCWENYMPLARYAMYAWGTEVYLAPTWDRGETWLATLQHIAKEGRLHVIGCCIAMRRDDIPDRFDFKRLYGENRGEWINVGDSAIVGPDGRFLAGPARAKEETLYAEIDPGRLQGKQMFDPAGHYARPDVFQLLVRRDARPMISTSDSESATKPEVL